MSQNDAPQQQGILGVRSFAVQLDSDSDAGSVRSNGIDSPPLDRKPEEKDSARRATLAALGLVPGPPPPVQPSQQQAFSPVLTPRGGLSVPQGTAHNTSRDLAAPSAYPVPKAADLRRPTSPVQHLRSIGFGPESWQAAALFRPSSPSAGRPVYNNFDSKNAGSEGLPTDERMTSSVTSHVQGTNHTDAFPSPQRAPINALQEVEAAEAAAPLLSSAGVDRTSSGGATASTGATASNIPSASGDIECMPVQPPASIVPSSPFQAVQIFDTSEPFVAPVVPPIRTKGLAPSSLSSTAPVRTSSRFQERFTSPTTTRIVDELLDEVVAHRLTPRDSTSSGGSGRQNEHPARPRGRGSNDDTVDLPRVKPAQDIQRGAGHGSSFRDLETAVPTAVAASAQSAFAPPAGESEPSSRATSQALSEERSSSIGEELKMVMKSERGGRLARDSAELLAGDKPGEFTVLTEEGSSIPVAVKDLPRAAAAASSAGAVAGHNAPVSEAIPMRNWWGSMTAALGLKGGAEGSTDAGSGEGAAGGRAAQEQPPAEQSELPLAVEQHPLAVSAFARDVAVKPVSAETADSSAVAGVSGGSAAATGSVLASPPVKDVSAEEAKPQSTGSGFEEALSLETLKQDPAGHTAEIALDAAEARQPIEAKRAGSTRRLTFQMEKADSFEEDTLGTVEDPSHRVSVDMTGAQEGSALAALIASSSAASAFAAAAVAPAHPPVLAERTGSEAAFMEAMPLELPSKKKKAPQAPAPEPDPQPSRPAVTAERTRSEVAFDEALPLERPRSRSKKSAPAVAPPPTDVPARLACPRQDSPGATWDNAVPLELTRKRGGAGSAVAPSAVQQPAPAAEKAGAWEEDAPLEGSSRKSTRSMPTSPNRAEMTASQPLEASPRPKAKLGRSSSSRASPPPVAPGDFSDEAEFAHDPDLARQDSLDQRLPLMHNLHGRYSLESSGTERYDLYIDRAAAYAKAQEGARKAALLAGHASPTRLSSLGSLDSATAATFATARRVPHMGGIAAGTHAAQLRGIHEVVGMEPEPDIDLPEPGTPTSESESEEADGDALFFPSQGKGVESGMGAGNKMHGLVGVSHALPPPSAFASAQPPRSVFADAQVPTSDSEAETDNASSPTAAAYVPVVSAHDIGRRNSQLEGKVKPGNGRTDLEAEQQMPETPPQKLPEARRPAFFCCFNRPVTR